MNLDDVFGRTCRQNDEATIYLEFESECEGIATVGMGCDWFFEAFCNGELCCSTMDGDGNGTGRYAPSNHPMFLPIRKGNNLLAVHVVRGGLTWSFAFGNVRFEPPDIAEVRCGPWLSNPEKDTVMVRFATYGRICSGVRYRPAGGEWAIVWDEALGVVRAASFHAVTLTGLVPGRDYEYQVVMRNGKGGDLVFDKNVYRFTAWNEARECCSFIFTADLQYTAEKQRDMLDAMLASVNVGECDFLVLGGDTGSVFEEENLIECIFPVLCRHGAHEIPVVACRGNHELRGRDASRYAEFYGNRQGKSYWMFRCGDTAFLVLDTMDEFNRDDVRRRFLEAEQKDVELLLRDERWLTARRRIVLAHGAPCSRNEKGTDISRDVRRMTDAWFAGKNPPHRLALWLAGHTHEYCRSFPESNVVAALTPQHYVDETNENYVFPVLTVAGPYAGQPSENSLFKVDVNPDRIVVSALDVTGTCFDRIEILNDGSIREFSSILHYSTVVTH